MAETSISAEIPVNAVGPKSMQTPDGTMTQHSLPDQVAADKYLRHAQAASSPFGCIKKTKVAFGGEV